MNTSVNNFDSIEKLIFEEGLRIQTIDFHKELDLMLIILNTKAILRQSISKYAALKNATQAQLNSYELISDGVGIHWKELDEDLSLKGFLKDEIKRTVYNDDSHFSNKIVV
ncbi:MAG: DUF2442 domain-containing protein [Bacteroidota bacterium]|nr:DUF2442 domain-containing protein [Bacteroidota bacterium]